MTEDPDTSEMYTSLTGDVKSRGLYAAGGGRTASCPFLYKLT